jgi:hypothetical protein
MMFLLRTALLTSVVLALLPSFVPAKSTTVAADLGAAEAVTAASATVADLGGLCERRPQACEAGAQFAAAFAQRTQAGAKIVYGFIGERLANLDRTRSQATGVATDGTAPAGDELAPVAVKAQNQPAGSVETLTATDLVPPWHGPQPRREARHRT